MNHLRAKLANVHSVGELRHLSDAELSEAVRAKGAQITQLRDDALENLRLHETSARLEAELNNLPPNPDAEEVQRLQADIVSATYEKHARYSGADDTQSARLLVASMSNGIADKRLVVDKLKDAGPGTLQLVGLERTKGGKVRYAVKSRNPNALIRGKWRKAVDGVKARLPTPPRPAAQ